MFRGARHDLKIFNRFIPLGFLLVPSAAFSQEGFGELLQRELDLTEQIETESIVSGPRSESLIDLLADLSQVYEDMGNFELADAATDRLLEVIRANYGLHSLEQVPAIRQLMSRQEEREDAVGLWELEQELLDLAERNPSDPRTISIFSGVAERRLEILRRYEAGEFPPEIILGCYYRGSFYTPDAGRRGSRPMYSANIDPVQHGCGSGSRSRVRRSLLNEAQTLYRVATEIALRSDAYPATEIRDLLTDVIRISYRTSNYGMGRSTYQRLLEYEADTGGTPLLRAERLVQLADWELYASSDLGRAAADIALAYYQGAYQSLTQQNAPQESIDALFNPDIPVLLPSFLRNPLDSSETGAAEYIDVSFNITRDGRSDDVEIVGTSANAARSDQRELVRTIKGNRFRPRLADGEWLDPAPVSLRYYLSN